MTSVGEDFMTWKGRPPMDVLAAANDLTARYEQAGSPSNICAKIWDQFGVGGQTFSGTFYQK